MFWCVSPWVYPVWDSLCLLDLIDYFLLHVGEIFNYNLFKNFLMPFCFLVFFWDPYNSNVGVFILSQMSLRLSSVLFVLFSLFCSLEVISTILSSSSLIRFSASDILLLIHSAVAAAKSLQSCPTPCNPRNSSPPGSSVPGILQARTLEWVAISFSNA